MGKSFTSTRKNDPLRVVLASNVAERMAELGAGLALYAEVKIFQADSGEKVQQLLGGHSGATIDLIVIDQEVSDMPGVEVAKMVARFHPFVASVLVSGQSDEDFHEETEGLGVLMRLPDPTAEGCALQILQQMARIQSVIVC